MKSDREILKLFKEHLSKSILQAIIHVYHVGYKDGREGGVRDERNKI